MVVNVSYEDYCSTPSCNLKHVLKGPNNDDDENQTVNTANERGDSIPEKPAKSAEPELNKSNNNVIFVRGLALLIEQLLQKWTSPIYVFFWPTPDIEYINSYQIYVFECTTKYCKGRNGRGICWFLDKEDTKLTSGLYCHVKTC